MKDITIYEGKFTVIFSEEEEVASLCFTLRGDKGPYTIVLTGRGANPKRNDISEDDATYLAQNARDLDGKPASLVLRIAGV